VELQDFDAFWAEMAMEALGPIMATARLPKPAR